MIDEDEYDFKEFLAAMTRDVRDQIVEHEQQIIATVGAVGGSTSRYRRERRSQACAIVSGIYAPRRVTVAANFFGRTQGCRVSKGDLLPHGNLPKRGGSRQSSADSGIKNKTKPDQAPSHQEAEHGKKPLPINAKLERPETS